MLQKRLGVLQSNVTKCTGRKKAEPYNTCNQRIFCLQAKVSPLKIAMVEIILPKIIRWGFGIRMSWTESFEKLIRRGTSR